MSSKKRKRAESPSPPAAAPAPDPPQGAAAPPAAPAAVIGGLGWAEVAVLGVILFVGFLLRVSYFIEFTASPDYQFPAGDAAFKDYWARAILSGDATPPPGVPDPQLATTPYVRPPAYPFFLAFVYLLTGGSYNAVRFLQFGVGLVNVVLLFYLARALFGRLAGLVAAGFMATYWTFIFFEAELTEVALTIFLILCITHFARSWLEGLTAERIWVPGALFGILLLARTETLLFLPVLLLWGLWALRGRLPLARRALAMGAFAGVVALTVSPVTLRNYIRGGEFVPICTIGGLNLYAGNNPGATGSFPDLDYRDLFGIAQTLSHHNFPDLVEGLRRKTGDETLGHADLERFFIRSALAHMAAHPWSTLGLMARKFGLFWGPDEVPSNKLLHFDRQRSPTLRVLPGFPIALGLGALGLAMWVWGVARRPGAFDDPRTRLIAMILLFVAVSCATHLLFFVVGRFRVPIVPFLILFGAYGVAGVARLAWRGDRAVALRWGVAGLALTGAAHVPVVAYEHDQVRWHFIRATIFGGSGKVAEAMREMQEAVRIGGDAWWLRSELGYGHYVQGNHAEAIRWLKLALESDPDQAITRNRLGYAYLAAGQPGEAAEQFEAALAVDFTDRTARHHLAGALADLGRPEEAERELRRLLEEAPGFPGARTRLGQVLVLQGRSEEAVAEFAQAVSERPDDADAHNAMGFELARLGRFEEALAAYAAAVHAAPRFALAHNNLGNLYAHLGKYDEARTHYMEALNINPNDPHADYGWGYVLAQQGDLARAISRFRQAIAKNPGHAEAHNYLGFALMGQGELGEAERMLLRALELEPRFALAHVNLAELLRRTGRPVDALRHLDLAVAIEPENEAWRAQADALRARVEGHTIRVPEGHRVLQF